MKAPGNFLCTQKITLLSFLIVLGALSYFFYFNVDRADHAWDLLADGALLIDVRTPAEFAEGHLKGAQNFPIDEIRSNDKILAGEETASIVLYCTAGVRSGEAVRILRERGFEKVVNGGGYSALVYARPDSLEEAR